MIDPDDEYWLSGQQISFEYFQEYSDAKTDDTENKKEKIAGSFCCRCKLYCQFSEPNQEDGSFKCYSCRHPW